MLSVKPTGLVVHMSCLMQLNECYSVTKDLQYREMLKSFIQNNTLFSCTSFIFPLNIQIPRSILFYVYARAQKIFIAAISVRIQNPVGEERNERQCKDGKAMWKRKNRTHLPWIQFSILNKCLQKAHPLFLDQMQRTAWHNILCPKTQLS